LRAAIVLCEREDHRAALRIVRPARGAGTQPLQIRGDLVEVRSHLLNLVVDRAALRGAAGKQREEAGAVAALIARMGLNPLEFALLAGGCILIAANLLGLGRIAAALAAIDGGKLAFEPLAHRAT